MGKRKQKNRQVIFVSILIIALVSIFIITQFDPTGKFMDNTPKAADLTGMLLCEMGEGGSTLSDSDCDELENSDEINIYKTNP